MIGAKVVPINSSFKEVEMIISNIPGLYQVLVFGVPDDYYGNALVACIQAEDFLDE